MDKKFGILKFPYGWFFYLKTGPGEFLWPKFLKSFLTLDFKKSQYFKNLKYLELETIAPFLIYPMTWFKKISLLSPSRLSNSQEIQKNDHYTRLIFGGEETGHLVVLGVRLALPCSKKCALITNENAERETKCGKRSERSSPDTRVSFNFTVHLREMVSGWEYPTSQIRFLGPYNTLFMYCTHVMWAGGADQPKTPPPSACCVLFVARTLRTRAAMTRVGFEVRIGRGTHRHWEIVGQTRQVIARRGGAAAAAASQPILHSLASLPHTAPHANWIAAEELTWKLQCLLLIFKNVFNLYKLFQFINYNSIFCIFRIWKIKLTLQFIN
jgi:hypothetical protein